MALGEQTPEIKQARIFGLTVQSSEKRTHHQVPARGELGLLWFEFQNSNPSTVQG
jgi:hypothetical protein